MPYILRRGLFKKIYVLFLNEYGSNVMTERIVQYAIIDINYRLSTFFGAGKSKVKKLESLKVEKFLGSV